MNTEAFTVLTYQASEIWAKRANSLFCVMQASQICTKRCSSDCRFKRRKPTWSSSSLSDSRQLCKQTIIMVKRRKHSKSMHKRAALNQQNGENGDWFPQVATWKNWLSLFHVLLIEIVVSVKGINQREGPPRNLTVCRVRTCRYRLFHACTAWIEQPCSRNQAL